MFKTFPELRKFTTIDVIGPECVVDAGIILNRKTENEIVYVSQYLHPGANKTLTYIHDQGWKELQADPQAGFCFNPEEPFLKLKVRTQP